MREYICFQWEGDFKVFEFIFQFHNWKSDNNVLQNHHGRRWGGEAADKGLNPTTALMYGIIL